MALHKSLILNWRKHAIRIVLPGNRVKRVSSTRKEIQYRVYSRDEANFSAFSYCVCIYKTVLLCSMHTRKYGNIHLNTSEAKKAKLTKGIVAAMVCQVFLLLSECFRRSE